MHFIGITGGVGAGKSFILDHLRDRYGAYVLRTDESAQELMLPGHVLHRKLMENLPASCFRPDGQIDKKAMADWMYADQSRIEKVNGLVHPAVIQEVLRQKDLLLKKGCPYFFVESALLLGSGLDLLLDECWYIYTSEEIRRSRLKDSRGYSDAKITSIFKAQLSEEEFRKQCSIVINNNGSREETLMEIDRAMHRLQ